MIKFTIDNKEIKIPADKTVLYGATQAGIDIPTLCHNGKVSHTTSCFVCVVKDVKTGRFLPSCSAKPAPGQVFESASPEVTEMRKAALELLLSEHSGDCEAPCTVACPAHAAVEEYVREGKEGNFLESLKIIKERIPLPLSIGRVCPRFCEQDCRRNLKGEAVAINEFKRLAADLHYDEYLEDLPELLAKKVAIIGAGPAGLAAAYYLRRQGIASELFEQMPEAGGMLRYGIPEYRLPKATLDKELAHWQKMGGIDFSCGVKINDDKIAELKEQFDAVIISIGCWKSSSMRCEGEEFASNGIDWLLNIANADWSGDNPGEVIVIGGGNTAMDCVRTSVRLGSPKVTCVYRRTEAEMPAEDIEILEAKEEGVNFQFLTAPVGLREENGKKILTCQRMELGEPDASGRRRPVPVEGSEFEMVADEVIAAIGQKTDATAGMKVNRWGDLDATEDSLHVEDNIFAAGDCVSGAATVVEAVAGGRKAALAAEAYINGTEFKEIKTINVSNGHWGKLTLDVLPLLNTPNDDDRLELEFIPLEERKTSMKEVTVTAGPAVVQQEGDRCFECSCCAKSDCKLKEHSETYGASPDALEGEKVYLGFDNRHPSIIHDRMKCIRCGICVKICGEVVNQNLLGLKDRGFKSIVGTAFDASLPESCTECGQCIPECPTGALSWKNK